VVGQIVPWNFPLNLASWKVGAALAVGNCVVLKPAEHTPSSAYELARIALEAGLPKGVLNVVSGGASTGRALVNHPDVDMIAFTGSMRTGLEVAQVAARTAKRVSLELGGKSAVIVFDDCSFDAAVSSVLEAAFFANGENCCAGSRLLVSSRIHQKFLAALVERARELRVGPPASVETQIGCLISMDHFHRILSALDSAVRDGAEIVTGGKPYDRQEFAGRPFLGPTIVVGAPNNGSIVQNEVFGPVLVVQTFESDEEAVFLANSTRYDLAAGIWTGNGSRAHSIARRLRAGSVWINTFNRVFNDAPFGGLKGSGYSRDLGAQAVSQYGNVKNICVCYEPGSDGWF
jgi:acyl-CoA reductase-like NAD-dependent aldehyde dehydrogenase